MEYDVNISGDVGTVTMRGRFTFSDNKVMRDIFEKIEGNVRNCIFDVGGLEFIDSAGLGMFILANDTISEKGGRLSLRRPSGQVRKMLDITKFGEVLTIEE